MTRWPRTVTSNNRTMIPGYVPRMDSVFRLVTEARSLPGRTHHTMARIYHGDFLLLPQRDPQPCTCITVAQIEGDTQTQRED
jgi:hypothetical protein